MTKPGVVVAMSGGVDSSAAAALLIKQGYRVTGMMLRLWSEPGAEDANRCCTPDSMALARRVAAKLDIPFYVIDAREVFHDIVVNDFIEGHARGVTPNPCILCNKLIRWDFLLNRALATGADYLATGHYVRLAKNQAGEFELRRAVDLEKDQSYVLYTLNQAQLAHALFPLGELTKSQVRQMAQAFGLPVAERRDSQDLCFLAGGDQRSFLLRQAPSLSAPGRIVDVNGRRLGDHLGLAFYTIGQRKGLGIASSKPLYVLHKDIANNELVVGSEDELGKDTLTAAHVHWISSTPPALPLEVEVKIRYRAPFAKGTIIPRPDGVFQVQFQQKLRDITPGQSAVFYKDEICLGGGIILG